MAEKILSELQKIEAIASCFLRIAARLIALLLPFIAPDLIEKYIQVFKFISYE